MSTIVTEALAPLDRTSCIKMYKNNAQFRLFWRIIKRSIEELLDRGDTKTTHEKNLQKLMVEIYKSMNHLNDTCGIPWIRKMFPTIYGLRNYETSPR